MKVYRWPQKAAALVFDIDLTLYRNQKFYEDQRRSQLEALADLWQKDYAELEDEITRFQKKWAENHQGEILSLANTLRLQYGLTIKDSVGLREKVIIPEDYLGKDKKLMLSLKKLKEEYRLIALTNNPLRIGERILKCLGIESFFEEVFGLDSTLKSKPAPEPFEKVINYLNLPPEQVVSIGDRYHVDLMYPLEAGWGGALLVENMDDLYYLKERLLDAY